jgi:hypothetical protein
MTPHFLSYERLIQRAQETNSLRQPKIRRLVLQSRAFWSIADDSQPHCSAAWFDLLYGGEQQVDSFFRHKPTDEEEVAIAGNGFFLIEQRTVVRVWDNAARNR